MQGKWHLGFFADPYLPTSRGFDSYYGYYLGAEDYYNHNRSYEGDDGYDLRDNTTPIFRNATYSTWMYGNRTMDLLKEYDQTNTTHNPFFIYVAFQAVQLGFFVCLFVSVVWYSCQLMHHFSSPLEAPKYIVDSFNTTIKKLNRRKKAAMTVVMDSVVGQWMHFIQNESQSKLWDNTLVIFSTDNGGPVQDAASNFPLRGSKATLWEGGVKGAGFVSGGYLNGSRRGSVMKSLMHITDWYPTLCAVAGCTPANESILDGYNQLGNIQSAHEDVQDVYSPRMEILHNIDPITCNLTICGGVRMGDYKMAVGWEVTDTSNICRSAWCPLPEPNQNYSTVRCTQSDGNYAYPHVDEQYIATHCPYNGLPCLYDISSDPCEYSDISQQQPAVYQLMWEKLLQYNNTMVTPLQLVYPDDKAGANPKKLGGFWSPWRNATERKREL